MRGFALSLALLAAIPAMVLPLFACVAVMSLPAAMIAGVAHFVDPATSGSTGHQR